MRKELFMGSWLLNFAVWNAKLIYGYYRGNTEERKGTDGGREKVES